MATSNRNKQRPAGVTSPGAATGTGSSGGGHRPSSSSRPSRPSRPSSTSSQQSDSEARVIGEGINLLRGLQPAQRARCMAYWGKRFNIHVPWPEETENVVQSGAMVEEEQLLTRTAQT